ncbi:MAG: hypothetical protein WAU77_02680 [Solirubrobacteraceae bacterium]
MAQREKAPKTIEALAATVLCARRSVIAAKRRRRKLAKPFYVNCGAAWSNGIGALAYASDSLGKRSAIVACAGPIEAEYLALLMAMMDIEECELPGPIEFRLARPAVADLDAATSPEMSDLRRRVVDRLARNLGWELELVGQRHNWIADAPARRVLSRWLLGSS